MTETPRLEAATPVSTRRARQDRPRRPGPLGLAGQGLIEVWSWRRLILNVVRAELRRENARLAFGSLWWILDALIYISVYTLLVTVILRRGGPDYPLFIFGPLLAWKWFAQSVGTACSAIVGNERIVRQLPFPRIALPIARLGVQLWRFLAALLVLLAIMAVAWPERLTSSLVWLPLLIAAQVILMVPIATLLAALTVFLRDTANVIRHLLRVAFFLMPVIYGLDQALARLPEALVPIYALNPLGLLLEGYRAVTYDGMPPPPAAILMPVGVGLVLIGPAFAIFKRLEPRFAKHL